jgi:hypothetical protein
VNVRGKGKGLREREVREVSGSERGVRVREKG